MGGRDREEVHDDRRIEWLLHAVRIRPHRRRRRRRRRRRNSR